MDNAALLDREHLMVLRKRRDLTQKELAIKSGISYGLIAALEAGDRTNPTIRTVKALAGALQVPGHELVPSLCACPDQSDAA